MARRSKSEPVPDTGLQVHTLARRSFFDVPVYRVSKERYDAEFKESVAELDGDDAELVRRLERDDPTWVARRRDLLKNSFGGSWQFNEIVGYIRLHFVGSQVRGELWWPEKERLKRTRTRQLAWRTHKVVPELELPRDATNQQVYETVHRYLDNARQKLNHRYIDTTVFQRIGPFIDWNGLRRS